MLDPFFALVQTIASFPDMTPERFYGEFDSAEKGEPVGALISFGILAVILIIAMSCIGKTSPPT